VLKGAFHDLFATAIPSSLRVAKLTLFPDGPTTSSVSTYRALDTLSLDNDLVRVLRYFDGRPCDEVLAEINDKEAISLDTPLLRLLLDYDILQEVCHTEH
jgi:hypothetical protein